MRRTPSVYRGFTLIELLVVVAIIAVLVAILLPAMARARTLTRTTKCTASLKQIGVAMQYYISDNAGVLPPGWGDGQDTSDDSVQGRKSAWYLVLGLKYLNYDHTQAYYVTGADSRRRNPFVCSETPDVLWGTTYAMSRQLSTVWCWNHQYRTADSFDTPAMTIVALDFYPGAAVADYWYPPLWSVLTDANTRRILRHGNVDNFLFLDGHCESLAKGRELSPPYVAMY
jgi:prepilin-type N-terminal cleavage/methylation domain-containing protein/prepilin-type processing-associated H-X9-DG protein